ALLRDPTGECERLREAAAAWGVALGSGRDGAVELDASKARNRSASPAFTHAAATAPQRALWELLPKLAGAHDTFSLPELPVPEAASSELLSAVAEDRSHVRELQRVTHSRKELASLLAKRTKEAIVRRP